MKGHFPIFIQVIWEVSPLFPKGKKEVLTQSHIDVLPTSKRMTGLLVGRSCCGLEIHQLFFEICRPDPCPPLDLTTIPCWLENNQFLFLNLVPKHPLIWVPFEV